MPKLTVIDLERELKKFNAEEYVSKSKQAAQAEGKRWKFLDRKPLLNQIAGVLIDGRNYCKKLADASQDAGYQPKEYAKVTRAVDLLTGELHKVGYHR